ncbi:hypothetical protein OsI_25126 [Oryza sativa Indica Group]|uniref:Uncharacterized protein n=1 Tax=Oryza sativa subsp. indica TaxID=39946 RepID=A2YIS4_ORYSI|nr:hypothetical protein OsI_25126 [Oryza sativa Indica Group]
MEVSICKPDDGQSLLANVEASDDHAAFDAMATSSRRPASLRPLRHPNVTSLAPLPPLHRCVPRQTEVIFPPLDSPDSSELKKVMSISLPATPTGFAAPVAGVSDSSGIDLRRQAMASNMTQRLQQRSPTSQSNNGRLTDETTAFQSPPPTPGGGRSSMSRDKRYDSFKTWSGRLERQISHLAGIGPDIPSPAGQVVDAAMDGHHHSHTVSTPEVGRFFAALEGPELDQLRSEEELVLPVDRTWPFLLRFPVSAFGICLGMGSQAILWKRIAESPPTTRYLHVAADVNLVLWWLSVALTCAVSAVYACKVVFFFEAVRREYLHPVRVNFFFAPLIACLFLAIGVPRSVAASTAALPAWLWYALMAPMLCLELKIYGQWMSSGQRRLSMVANPSNHLSVVGNFVGALLGASMGIREGALFFFAVGVAHYVVLFVTLYQRLPTNEALPRELHPVFFLFVATPSVASVAWAAIAGEFALGARLAYFVAMFLYASLAARAVSLFGGVRFSLAWWAYTFPMTSAAAATIRYAAEVDTRLARALCVALAAAATLTVGCLFATTVVHAVVLRSLFPNDVAIAITDHRKVKPKPKPKTTMEVHYKMDGNGDIECGAPAMTPSPCMPMATAA